jgi:hypothetical protein
MTHGSKWRRWTPEEDDLLRQYAESKDAYELAELLNCKHERVRGRAYRLGLKIKKVPRPAVHGRTKKYLYWTDAEKNILRRMVKDGENWAAILDKFKHRPEGGVKGQVYAMGLVVAEGKSWAGRDWTRSELTTMRVYGHKLACRELRDFFFPHRTIHDVYRMKREYENYLEEKA